MSVASSRSRAYRPALPAGHLSRRTALLWAGAAAVLTACSSKESGGSSTAAPTLFISAIPDQDPELLNRLYPAVAERFAEATGAEVEYRPVTDYTAVVRAFELGDIHLAWMGGLTGVQARARVPEARAIVQRDIDADFHTVFIANKGAGLEPFKTLDSLRTLTGHSLTFGSETSTSGRLMPEYFLEEADVDLDDLKGKPGFSGSHDATIEVVANGSYEVGALNEQVWKSTVEAGDVDLGDVVVLWRSPGYADYHWLARPDLDEKFGAGTEQKVVDLLLGLDKDNPEDAEILELFGAESFITTKNSNYDRVEAVARDLDLLQ